MKIYQELCFTTYRKALRVMDIIHNSRTQFLLNVIIISKIKLSVQV
jgi:hypothetical protein